MRSAASTTRRTRSFGLADVLANLSRPSQSTGGNIAALDGLRGVAVLGVVGLHLLELSRAGLVTRNAGAWAVLGTGVELFFVLSGFLLTLPYARSALTGRPIPSLRRYFRRRALRILPAYWASLVLFVLWIAPVPHTRSGLLDVGLHITLAHNYLTTTFESINGPYWTMAVEAQFYLLLPLIGLALVRAFRAAKPWRVVAVFVAIAACSVTAEAAVHGLPRWDPGFARHQTVVAVFQYLAVFGAGILASLAYVAASEGRFGDRDVRSSARTLGAVGVAALVLCVVLNRSFSGRGGAGDIVTQVAGVAYAAIVLGVLLGWEAWRRWLSNAALRFVGTISYSMYLWNRVVLRRLVGPLVRTVTPDTGILFVALVAAASVVILVPISLASYLAFERPFLGRTVGRTGDPLVRADAIAAP